MLRKLSNKRFMEKSEDSTTPSEFAFLWFFDGFSRRPGSNDLFVRYYDGRAPKPHNDDDFEYTLYRDFLSWAIPVQDLNVADEGSSSISEGVSESLPLSEGEVSAPDDAPALAPRRSSRRIPVRAAVLKYKHLLHVIHKHLPIRLTKRRKDGSIVLVSKAKVIQKFANRIEPASMKKALAGEHAK